MSPGPPLTDTPTALSGRPGSSSSSNPFGFRADDEAGPDPGRWSCKLTRWPSTFTGSWLPATALCLLTSAPSMISVFPANLKLHPLLILFKKPSLPRGVLLALCLPSRSLWNENDVPRGGHCQGGRLRTSPPTQRLREQERPRGRSAGGQGEGGKDVRSVTGYGPSERGRQRSPVRQRHHWPLCCPAGRTAGLTPFLGTSPQKGDSREKGGVSQWERLMITTDSPSLGATPAVPELCTSKPFPRGRCRSCPTLRGCSPSASETSVTGCSLGPCCGDRIHLVPFYLESSGFWITAAPGVLVGIPEP